MFEATPLAGINHALHPVFLKTKGYPFNTNHIEVVDGLLSVSS